MGGLDWLSMSFSVDAFNVSMLSSYGNCPTFSGSNLLMVILTPVGLWLEQDLGLCYTDGECVTHIHFRKVVH